MGDGLSVIRYELVLSWDAFPHAAVSGIACVSAMVHDGSREVEKPDS